MLERDPEPAPVSVENAWENWSREGVTQFHQPHYLQSRGRIILEEELPIERPIVFVGDLVDRGPDTTRRR